jgi:hypothetical protein
MIVLDLDATLVMRIRRKRRRLPGSSAASVPSRAAWCDNTRVAGGHPAPPQAGSNDAADQCVGAGIAQVPAEHRRHLLIRADGAGATHQPLDWLTSLDRVRVGMWSTRSASPTRMLQ